MIFFDYLIKSTEKLPTWFQSKSIWYNFALLIGDLLNNVNIYKEQLTKALNLSLPEPNKRCLEAFLNDLYDPVGRNIQILGFVDENFILTPNRAYVSIFIPPNELTNPNLPTDLSFISKLVGKLLPLPLGNEAQISVITAYTIALQSNGQNYTIAIKDSNGNAKSTAFLKNINK